MAHVDQGQLLRWLGDQLDLAERASLDAHLSECEQCAALLADLTAEEETLTSSLALSEEEEAWVTATSIKAPVMKAIAPLYVRWQVWILFVGLAAIGSWLAIQVLDVISVFIPEWGPVGTVAQVLQLVAVATIRGVGYLVHGSPVLYLGPLLLIVMTIWFSYRSTKEAHDHA